MRFKSNAAKVGYVILCVVLSAALIFGIVYIVYLGNKYEDRDVDGRWGAQQEYKSTPDTSTPQQNSDSSSQAASSDTIDTYNLADGNDNMKTRQLSTSAISYEIDIPYGNVSIYPTDKEPYVEYSDRRDIEILTHEDNNYEKIKVKMPNNLGNILDSDKNKFNVNFFLPKDKLDNFKVDLDAGNIIIEGIKAKNFELDVDAGNCKIQNCETDKFIGNVDAGNVEFYANSGIRSIDLDVDAGLVKLFLPKDIMGFAVNYDVSMGIFNNESEFNTYSSNSGVVGKKGVVEYGNSETQIRVDIDAGNFILNSY